MQFGEITQIQEMILTAPRCIWNVSSCSWTQKRGLEGWFQALGQERREPGLWATCWIDSVGVELACSGHPAHGSSITSLGKVDPAHQ